MKTVEQIIGYLEGKLSELEKHDPEPVDAYVIKEILKYIKLNS